MHTRVIEANVTAPPDAAEAPAGWQYRCRHAQCRQGFATRQQRQAHERQHESLHAAKANDNSSASLPVEGWHYICREVDCAAKFDTRRERRTHEAEHMAQVAATTPTKEAMAADKQEGVTRTPARGSLEKSEKAPNGDDASARAPEHASPCDHSDQQARMQACLLLRQTLDTTVGLLNEATAISLEHYLPRPSLDLASFLRDVSEIEYNQRAPHVAEQVTQYSRDVAAAVPKLLQIRSHVERFEDLMERALLQVCQRFGVAAASMDFSDAAFHTLARLHFDLAAHIAKMEEYCAAVPPAADSPHGAAPTAPSTHASPSAAARRTGPAPGAPSRSQRARSTGKAKKAGGGELFWHNHFDNGGSTQGGKVARLRLSPAQGGPDEAVAATAQPSRDGATGGTDSKAEGGCTASNTDRNPTAGVAHTAAAGSSDAATPCIDMKEAGDGAGEQSSVLHSRDDRQMQDATDGVSAPEGATSGNTARTTGDSSSGSNGAHGSGADDVGPSGRNTAAAFATTNTSTTNPNIDTDSSSNNTNDNANAVSPKPTKEDGEGTPTTSSACSNKDGEEAEKSEQGSSEGVADAVGTAVPGSSTNVPTAAETAQAIQATHPSADRSGKGRTRARDPTTTTASFSKRRRTGDS
mmetsp:Transcript_17156/g.43751  ORF Transcript_17156/g.43751 Transcript_17156/m.43751 type:complete len:638 (+) Transcript_17156:351-2264(+)